MERGQLVERWARPEMGINLGHERGQGLEHVSEVEHSRRSQGQGLSGKALQTIRGFTLAERATGRLEAEEQNCWPFKRWF